MEGTPSRYRLVSSNSEGLQSAGSIFNIKKRRNLANIKDVSFEKPYDSEFLLYEGIVESSIEKVTKSILDGARLNSYLLNFIENVSDYEPVISVIFTPLIYMVKKINIEDNVEFQKGMKIIDLLLKSGADINLRPIDIESNVELESILNYAMKYRYFFQDDNSLRNILNDKNKRRQIEDNINELFEYLLMNRADPNAANGHSGPLYNANRMFDIYKIKLLLNYGAKSSPFLLDRNITDDLRLLYLKYSDKPGSYLKDKHERIILYSNDKDLFYYEINQIIILLKHNPNDIYDGFKDTGTTAFMLASQMGNIGIIRRYLTSLKSMENQIDMINKKDYMDNTSLHYSINKSDNSYMVLFLIENGGDLSIINKKGFTPLKMLIEKKYFNDSRLEKYINNKILTQEKNNQKSYINILPTDISNIISARYL